jgi:hypothetical protein
LNSFKYNSSWQINSTTDKKSSPEKLKRGFIVLLKPNPETYLKFHALRQKVFKIFPKDSSLLKAYISVKAR